MRVGRNALVTTRKEKCRMCYTCIRECPAKAIRVTESQASVDFERCIGCGNCVRVCTQAAKVVYSCIEETRALLRSNSTVVAILAPSFPAEFLDHEPQRLVGALHELGFASVFEVSFGADLVAHEYSRLLDKTQESYIGTTCPSVVAYIQKYHPDLVPHLVPVVSPMIATARVARRRLGDHIKVVFIGPCIAKKGEASERGEVDTVLTFPELRELFAQEKVDVGEARLRQFETPVGGRGGLFAITRGLLQAANLKEDILDGDILAAEGNPRFVAAIEEFRRGGDQIRLLELLSCNGCIMGVGFSNDDPLLVRRSRVSEYVRHRMRQFSRGELVDEFYEYSNIPLGREFECNDQRVQKPSEDELTRILATMGKTSVADELNCGACGYMTCRQCAAAIHRGLAEPEMCLPYTIEHLRQTIDELEDSHQDLLKVREALNQSEKLASMGQMAAGIAHEVNNPLGIVLLYANLLLESCSEKDKSREDVAIIVEQANRCRKIVMGLLNFARQNKVFRQQSDVVKLCHDVLRSCPVPEEVSAQVVDALGESSRIAYIDADQMQQLLVNLINNAVAAMPHGGQLIVRVLGTPSAVTFVVEDTGTGISKENQSKIFEPFFSTKPVGKGTGLGLAVVHGIVKMHQGRIAVTSNDDPAAGKTGTSFSVTIPREEPGN